MKLRFTIRNLFWRIGYDVGMKRRTQFVFDGLARMRASRGATNPILRTELAIQLLHMRSKLTPRTARGLLVRLGSKLD